MKKRILITACSLEIGGIERSLVGLLDALDTSRYDVDVLLFSRKGELLGFVPSDCNLLPEIPQCATLLKPIKTVLLEGHFLLGAARLIARRSVDRQYAGPADAKTADGVVFALLDEDMQPVEKDGAAWIETTDEGGSAVFFGVADGVYYLRELRTVNGKMLLTGEVRVTVEEGKTEETELTVRNSAAVPLSAGGMGDGILYCLAAALSLLSLRLRRKEGRSHG